MEQQIVQEKRITIWKRLGVFILDCLMSVIIFLVLLYTATNPLIRVVAKNDIATMNNAYQETCEKYDYPYRAESLYGLYTFDQNTYLDYLIDNELETDVEKAYDKCQAISQAIDKELASNQEYQKGYKRFYSNYVVFTILTMFLPLFVFQLIIPLYSHKKQTLMMRAFKVAPVEKKSNVIISNKKVLGRFLIIFILETIVVWLLLSAVGIIFIILGSLACISITRHCLTFHDAILQIKVVDQNYAYQ